jgi:hypothetical protein
MSESVLFSTKLDLSIHEFQRNLKLPNNVKAPSLQKRGSWTVVLKNKANSYKQRTL